MRVNRLHQELEQRAVIGLFLIPRRVHLSNILTAVSCGYCSPKGDGLSDEHLVVSLDYRRVVFASGICLAQTGDFYLTEKELPGGQFKETDHGNH